MTTKNKWKKLDAELMSEKGLKSWGEYVGSDTVPALDKMIALKQLYARYNEPGEKAVKERIEALFGLAGA